MNKILLVVLVLGLVFVSGCNIITTKLPCKTDSDCGELYYCDTPEGIISIGSCEKRIFSEHISDKNRNSSIPLNLTNVTYDLYWNKPKSEVIPEDYVKIKIYETVCEYSGFINQYCYNKSREIWIKN